MASTEQPDGSEDVNDFLRRIKELEDKREREDSERTRKLEEDIIQGKKQREARRAERARSLSPEKGSPATTPRVLNSPRSAARPELSPSLLASASTPPALSNSIDSRLDSPSVPDPQKLPETDPSSGPLADGTVDTLEYSAASPRQAPAVQARSNAVAWQQRPTPTDSTHPSAASSKAPSSDTIGENTTLSRSQIAQNLASKDPSWFRQTDDGARGSAAFRRNIQDQEPEARQPASKKELAGMSQPIESATDFSPMAKDSSTESLSQTTIPQVSSAIQQGRSPSPTKGMGGFVQSAMLKRSESVNKRWSAQPTTPGLSTASRGLGVANDGSYPSESPALTSTPSLLDSSQNGGPNTSETPLIQPSVSSSRSQTPRISRDLNKPPSADLVDRPPSPSKRWSPMKSTWLESALNKPEVTSPPKYAPSQPTWMSQLAKAKQERASRESVSIQTPPPTVSSSNTREVTSPDSASQVPRPQPKPKPQSLSPTPVGQEEADQNTQLSNDPFAAKVAKPATPPKKDFRSQLKSSTPQPSPAADETLEFRNVFGKLKSTKTENYVAPDELKDNILRGKAALAVTGGPQKSARRDELKESLVKQREAMKAKAQEPAAISSTPATPAVASVPEAIAKKSALASSVSSNKKPLVSPAPKPEPVEQFSKKPESPGPLQPKPPHTLNEKPSNFNANLANILAKGPPRQNSNESKPSVAISQSTALESASTQSTSKSGQLQHATRTRAKGPKRRLPNAAASAMDDQPTKTPLEDSTSKVTGLQHEAREIESPTNARSTVSSNPSFPLDSPKSTQEAATTKDAKQERTSPNSPVSQDRNIDASTSERISVREATAIWSRPHGHVQLSPTRNAQETRVEHQQLQESPIPATAQSSSNTSRKIEGNEVGLPPKSLKTETSTQHNQPPATLPPKPTVRDIPSPVHAAQPNPISDAEKALAEFFGRVPTAPSKADIDVKSIVHAKPAVSSGIQTVRKQVREVGSDGKLLPVSPAEEHVLISNRMYLCTHEFLDPQKARKTEAYLWIGAIVSEAAVEDAHLFARKAAKEAGASLIAVRQGKEPANLFQALGGILITRSGWTKDASNNYILCGRSHMGNLAFDEVSFSTSSLCSGFPYVIRASSDRVFLWKGSGCTTEELSAARLLSMDIGQTGQVQEIDEGQEPAEFFAVFPSTDRAAPKSAQHWKSKADHERYASRLFQIEHTERPISRQNSGTAGIWKMVRRQSQPDLKSPKETQIKEIAPFTQSDLKSESIYVLDSFFDLYIVLGSASNSKPEAFAAALMFAQEYATLSSSVDERPHVPVTTVVLEGVPKDMKRVFRRWDDDLLQTRNGPTETGVKRGKSLKILPLSKALAALGSK